MAIDINPFNEINEAMPKGWKVRNVGADRALFVSPSGQEHTIPLNRYEEQGAFGSVWMSGNRVIQPALNMEYQTGTGHTKFRGSTSAQEIAYRMKHAEALSKTRKTNLESEWNRLMMQGDEDLQIPTTPTLAYGENPSVHRTQALSMSMRFSSDRTGSKDQAAGVVWRDEIASMQNEYGRNLQLASLGNKGMPANPIEFDPGGQGDFNRLGQYMMAPSKEGHLIPLALPGATPNAQGWLMQNDYSKILKAPSLQVKGGTAKPYRMLPTGGVQPIEPLPITNTSKPNYAIGNVLDEFDNPIIGKRMSAVIGLHPVPGAGTLYEDPKNMKIGETFWGSESNEFAPIQNTNILDILSGKSKLNIDPLRGEYGGGVPVSKLGTLQVGDQKPEDIKGRFGPSIFRPNSTSFVIPEYIDKMTGEGVVPGEEYFAGVPSNIVSTESLTGDLQKKLGMPIIRDANRMGLQMSGDIEAAVAIKGRGLKVGQYGVGETQSINLGGQNVPVTLHTAEAKGPAPAISALTEKSPEQLQGIMRRFSAMNMNRQQSRQFMNYFNQNYMGNQTNPQGLGVSMNKLSAEYSRITGAEQMSGGIFGAQMYNQVFMTPQPGSRRDQQNLRRFGEASAGGAELFTGVWHPDQFKWMQGEWARAYRGRGKEYENAPQEDIDKSFNETFSYQQRGDGFYRVNQRTVGSDRYTNIIQPLTQEWVHGSDVGVEFQMAASGKFPGFAKSLGIHVESLRPQGPQQSAKWGLAMYASFQGSRRDQFTAGGDFQMPTKYKEVSRDTLMSAQAFLKGGGKEMSHLEKLQHLVNNQFKDVAEDEVLWSKEAKTFLPNPKAILGSTFSEMGIESAQVAKVYNSTLERMGDVVNPDYDLEPEMMQSQAIEETQGMFNYVTSIIGGSGDFLKGMLSRNTNQAIGGNMTFDPTLAPNQARYGKGLLGNVARQLGYTGKGIAKAVRSMATNAMQVIQARWPIPSEEGVQALTSQTDQERASAMGQAAFQATENNPMLKNVASVSGPYNQANIGDSDYDKFLALMGVQRGENGDLNFLNDEDVANNQLTLERAREIEQTYFHDPEFANAVNAPVQQFTDMIDKKGIMAGAFKNLGKRFDPREVVQRGFEVMQSSGIGMGVGYNPRRAIGGIMGAAGYSNEEVAYAMSSVPSEYQTALDRMLKGRFAAGMPSAAVIAQSYFGQDESGNGYLKLASTGAGTTRRNRKGPNGEILPETRSPGITLPFKSDYKTGKTGLLDNRAGMLAGTDFLVKQFAEGAELSKGGRGRMGKEQVAQRFALPGERKTLAEMMQDDPESWNQTIQGYYMDVIDREGSVRAGLSKIFQTPQWGGVLTQAGTKARAAYDPITGKGGVPGAQDAAEEFFSELPEEVQANFKAAKSYNEAMRRGRGSKQLRNMVSTGINAMARRLPEDSVFGQFARSMARGMNVSMDDPDSVDSMFPNQIPEAVRGERERFARRRHQESIASGSFSGTFDEYQALERSQNQEMASRSAERNFTPTPAAGQEYEQPAAAEQPRVGTGTGPNAAGISELGDDSYHAEPVTQADQHLVEQFTKETGIRSGEVKFSYEFDRWRKRQTPAPTPTPASAPAPEPMPDIIQQRAEVRQRANNLLRSGGRSQGQRTNVRSAKNGGVGGQPPRGGGPSNVPPQSGDDDWVRYYAGNDSNDVVMRVRRSDINGGTPVHTYSQESAQGTGGEVDPNKPMLPIDLVRKPPQRIGYDMNRKILGIQAYATREPLMEQVHNVLTGLGYEGENTPESVRTRSRRARVEDEARFFGAFTPGQLKQGGQLAQLQQDQAYIYANMDTAAGFDQQRGTTILKEAMKTNQPGLGQDLSALGYIFKDAGGKSTNLRMGHSLEEKPSFRGLQSLLRGRGVYDLENFGDEQVDALKQIFAENPGMQKYARVAAGVASDKNMASLHPQVAQVGEVMNAAKKMEPGILKDDYIKLAGDSVQQLNKTLKDTTEITTKLNEAKSKGNKHDEEKYTKQLKMNELEQKAARQGILADSAQKRIDQIQAGYAPGAVMAEKDLEKVDKYQRVIDRSRKAQSATEMEIADAGSEKWGSAARRMLGGFGMMYLGAITNFATQGLGYGMEARQKFDETGSQGAQQFLGAGRMGYNQQNIYATNQALYGVNNNPMSAMQSMMAQQPVARDLWNSASAGIGVWGYTQFAAGQIGGDVGKGLAKAALPLAAIAGVGAMVGDAWSRAQDTQGLAYRVGTGKAGINDLLGVDLLNFDPEKQKAMLDESGFYKSFDQAARLGAPTKALMQLDPSRSKADHFFALQRSIAEQARFKNYSFEAQTSTAGYLLRSGGNTTDKGLENIISDYQFGGWGEKTAMGVLSSIGGRASDVYGKKGADFQKYLVNQQFSEEEKAAIAGGGQRAAQLQGFEQIKGLGVLGGEINSGKLVKALKQLEGLSDSSFNLLSGQMQTYALQRSAGLRTGAMSADQLQSLTEQAANMTPEQRAVAEAQNMGFASQAQNRMNLGQQQLNQSYQFGNYAMGDRARKIMTEAPAGQEWFYNRALNLDPMVMARASQRGFNLASQPGMATMNGTQIGAEYSAFTDTNLGGQVTGLHWGQTSFNLGNVSGSTMANRIFGQGWQGNSNFNSGLIQAGVSGYQLPGGMTLPDGSTMTSVGGQMGMQLYASQMAMQQQLAQSSIQSRGLEQNITYQYQLWGIEDRQRALGHQNQMWQFGFQERQIDQNVRQQGEQWGLQRYETGLQRSWQREDWGYNAQMRNMQWGWKQEDFQEESRFMTGRQRRLAERQNQRDTTVHNLEGDQIDRQKGRQEELWKIEDERFKMQKRHFEEGVQMQREQLEHSRKFYLENKKLEDEKIKLQRAHWEDEMKLQRESIKLSQRYAVEQHKINVTMAQLSNFTELANGQLRTMTDDGMERLRQSVMDALPFFSQLADELDRVAGVDANQFITGMNSTISTPPITTGGSTSTGGHGTTPKSAEYSYIPMQPASQGQQTINVYVGNERLATHVVDIVSQELRVQ